MMIIFKVGALILLFALFTQTFASPNINNSDFLFHIDKGIYTIRFHGGVGSEGEDYRLSILENRERLKSVMYDDKFKPISDKLNKIISSKSTDNPFRESFPQVYTPRNIAKRLKCAINGVRLEIDNNPATKEWLIGFIAPKCIDRANYSKHRSDNKIHQWILQQKKDGKYRVLMQAESELTHIINTNLYKGYKQIKTKFSVARTIPDHPLKCGDAKITWEYASDDRYHIKTVLYGTDGCWQLYPDHDSSEYEWKTAMKAKVINAINSWILPLEGQVPVRDKMRLE